VADVAAPDALTGAWEGRVGARLAGLAGARIVAQLLGVGWFVVAARTLSADDFGILSGGLALMVVLGGFSDLGTTRTVVRHVAEDPRRLWATYWRALGLRVACGAIVGAIAVLLLRVASIDLPSSAVALAAWIAIASGANEVGYAALRSVGRVRVEMALLVLERALFTVIACTAVVLGAGPLLALGVYAATNTLTAALATLRLRQLSHGVPSLGSGPLLDAEGRRTAIASGLVIVAPRVSAIVLLILASRAAVGSLAVAQKPTDALSLLAVAMLTPMLPMLRSRVMAGRRQEAVEMAARFTSLVLLLCGPVLAWLLVDASGVLRLLYGDESRPGASTALVVLAVASVIAMYRTLGELLCLAEEKAGRYVVAIASGTAAALVASIVLVGANGAAGAAWASLIGEVVVLALVLRALPALRTASLLATIRRPAAVTVLTAIGVLAVRDVAERAALVVVGLGTVASLLLARPELRSIDRSVGGAAGDHADVGAQPRRYDVG
jgi:O-antigen/teichoic acid export membrane protein